MSVPNRKAVIESVMAMFAAQTVAPAAEIDGIGRRLLPHFIEAMPIAERSNWGVLRKSTGTFPYDILVWKPTREHIDVLTSRAVSGDEQHDKTGPRRLIGTWGNVGVLPRLDWTWCDWRQSGIVPLESAVVEPPAPPVEPPVPPPVPPDQSVPLVELVQRVSVLEAKFAALKAAL